ncbi:hypothetical protein KBY96_12645, partial [Cyanobium sp. ATX 6A2]|uniref:hypothetical protein n=1 Tax=Cyanobium sp. ATX 6A2 TaxID=2823700 RepID=UPI0020CD8F04
MPKSRLAGSKQDEPEIQAEMKRGKDFTNAYRRSPRAPLHPWSVTGTLGTGVRHQPPVSVLRRLWKTRAIRAKIPLQSLVRTGMMGSKQLGFGDYEQATAKKRT